MQKEMQGAGERMDDSSWARSEGSQAEVAFSDQFLKAIEEDLSLLHKVGISFSLHKETGRTMVKVFDKETNKLIREIPPEEFLDLAVKIHEMVGILFDKRV
ncbi:MAG: flagellar protein FlaG [Deltaproteobacteria bacterium]